MLSFQDCVSVGNHPLVRKFLQGVFHRRPTLPHHNVTWDTDVVFEFLKKCSPAKHLSFFTADFESLSVVFIGFGPER